MIRRERALSAVCACGCGTAIPAVNVDGKPMRYAHGHNNCRAAKLRREHDRIVARIRSIPVRPTLY